jgi:hypothetical protein
MPLTPTPLYYSTYDCQQLKTRISYLLSTVLVLYDFTSSYFKGSYTMDWRPSATTATASGVRSRRGWNGFSRMRSHDG